MTTGSIQAQPEALQALHEILEPAPASWAPQTVGWYVLGVLLLAGAIWWAVRRYRHWQANRYRGAALAELDRIRKLAAQASSRVSALRELPILVKRTALSFGPRTGVASLAGDDWLRFLDGTFGGDEFSRGAGRLLVGLGYWPEARLDTVGQPEIDAVFDLVGRWISRHSAPPPTRPVSSAPRSYPGSPSPSTTPQPPPVSSVAGVE